MDIAVPVETLLRFGISLEVIQRFSGMSKDKIAELKEGIRINELKTSEEVYETEY
ncbi:MAG: hypothetical protein IJ736_02710 [Firmicutes bacterium]|nr:hypothetical protein [Bacillota bacterium]MBR1735917.1 hypothetical protein [Bacillota bacterium]